MPDQKYVSSVGKQQGLLRTGLEAIVISGITVGLYSLPSNVIEEYYSNGLFRQIAKLEGIIGDAVPISVLECSLIGAGVFAAYCVGKSIVSYCKSIYRSVKNKRKVKNATSKSIAKHTLKEKKVVQESFCDYLFGSFVRSARVLSAGLLSVMLLGGLNYNRVSFGLSAGINSDELTANISPSNLTDLVQRILKKKEKIGVFRFEEKDLLSCVNNSVNEAYYLIHGCYVDCAQKNKKAFFFLDFKGAEGITFLSFDSVVNCDNNEYFSLWALGHEKAHLKGYLRECDAEALNYLACLNSGNDLLEYCALLHLFDITVYYLDDVRPRGMMNALQKMSQAEFSEFKRLLLSAGELSSFGVVADSFLNTINDERDLGQKNTVAFNKYIVQTVPLLWAIDKEYNCGRLNPK